VNGIGRDEAQGIIPLRLFISLYFNASFGLFDVRQTPEPETNPEMIPASSPLTFGTYADGAPNAIFDQLNRVVCSFPTDRTTDTRKGSPSNPETALANARLFIAAQELLDHLRILAAEDSQCAPDWVKKKKAARAAIVKAEGRL